jgi:hypothetical protein
VTLIQVLEHIVHVFSQYGAHHVYASKQAGNGYVVTKHFLVAVCHIRAGHGTFHCSAVVTR